MTNEQKEDLKEILVCLLDEVENLTRVCNSLNNKLETGTANILKIQNQLLVTNCIISDTTKSIDNLKSFITELETTSSGPDPDELSKELETVSAGGTDEQPAKLETVSEI